MTRCPHGAPGEHPAPHFPDLPDVDPAALELFREYKRSMMLHRRLLAALFSDSEMHPAQAGCLQVLAAHSGFSQSDLAETLHVSKPTVTTMLQRMEAAGTIERRADESDSRVTRVHITQEGRRVAAELRAHIAEEIELSVGGLTAAERDELTRLLAAVNANLESALVERGVTIWGHGAKGCAE